MTRAFINIFVSVTQLGCWSYGIYKLLLFFFHIIFSFKANCTWVQFIDGVEKCSGEYGAEIPALSSPSRDNVSTLKSKFNLPRWANCEVKAVISIQ